MKGFLELTDTFVKILSLSIAVVAIFIIFIAFNSYNANVYVNKLKREAMNIGEASLGAPCLVESNAGKPVKALFSQEKITKEKSGGLKAISCLKYPKKLMLEIESEKGSAQLGDPDIKEISYGNDFPAAIKMGEDVYPAVLTVYVEKG